MQRALHTDRVDTELEPRAALETQLEWRLDQVQQLLARIDSRLRARVAARVAPLSTPDRADVARVERVVTELALVLVGLGEYEDFESAATCLRIARTR